MTRTSIGVFHGASLIAAMLGNEDKRCIGVHSFGFRGATFEKVHENLARFGLAAPEILVGDAFELVPGGALGGVTIGVWYYDAAHSYEAQLDGLRIAEPLLASGALIVVDDTDWDEVARAMDAYLAQQPPRAARAHNRRQVTRRPLTGGRECRCSSGTVELRRGAEGDSPVEQDAARGVQLERHHVRLTSSHPARYLNSGRDRAVHA
jgi:predicted O-methyltransferase YrrM